MKRLTIIALGIIILIFSIGANSTFAQVRRPSPTPTPTPSPSPSPEASASAILEAPKEDITQPETAPKEDVLARFEKRRVSELKPYNFIAYYVQKSVEVGVPANTVILIILLPFLATLSAFTRHILGLASLEMLVPIAFSVALVSTGISAGTIILLTILLATAFSRLLLKNLRIMQMPRKSLTILIVSVFVFASLTLSAAYGILGVNQLSIFPILILILLGEKIISVQLTRSLSETFTIVSVTIVLGLIGFAFLNAPIVRDTVLLYPEITLALIPTNILIGRYFGLRFTEVWRFSKLTKNANH